MQVFTVRDIPDSFDGWPRDQRAEALVRRDGDKVDVIQSYFFPENRKRRRSVRYRMVLTKKHGVLYYAGLNRADPPPLGIINYDWKDCFCGYGMNEVNGGPLDGYFPSSSVHRVAELLLEAPDVHLCGTETIDGTPCKIVAAQSRHGAYRMWIAESKSFVPLRVRYDIGPTDLHGYADDRAFSELTVTTPDHTKHFGSRASGILEKVQVARIGDVHVPVAGTFTLTEWYGDVRLLHVNSYERKKIMLAPDFAGTDAFVTDLPVGAELNNMMDKSSGVVYEWRSDQAMRCGTEFHGTPAVGSAPSTGVIRQCAWACLGLVLIATGIYLSRIAQQRASRRAPRTAVSG